MNRAQAAERIRKLEALGDPGRGGTKAEQQIARAKARELRSKFRIVDPVEGVARTRAAPGRPASHPQWVAPTTGAAWGFVIPEFEFDMETGQASDNVEVHHHRGRGNWKITIHDEDSPARRALDERRRRGLK